MPVVVREKLNSKSKRRFIELQNISEKVNFKQQSVVQITAMSMSSSKIVTLVGDSTTLCCLKFTFSDISGSSINPPFRFTVQFLPHHNRHAVFYHRMIEVSRRTGSAVNLMKFQRRLVRLIVILSRKEERQLA